MSWWSVNTALVVKAAAVIGQAPCGVRMLGVDETRARSVRWLLTEAGWRRTDPWMRSFIDLDPADPGGILGLAPGRSGASVRGWLGLQSPEFRAGIEVVAVDPSAPFAAALREVPPHATLVVDHWHSPAGEPDAHPGPAARHPTGPRAPRSGRQRQLGLPPVAAARRPVSVCQAVAPAASLFSTDDPTGQIQAAWAGKEPLRQLLDALPATDRALVTDPRRDPAPGARAARPGLRPYEIRARLHRFYALAAQAEVPKLERLAATVETWWPAIQAYLLLRVTNARTEGYHRKIKQIKRVACGFRNQQSYERRILLNNAATAA